MVFVQGGSKFTPALRGRLRGNVHIVCPTPTGWRHRCDLSKRQGAFHHATRRDSRAQESVSFLLPRACIPLRQPGLKCCRTPRSIWLLVFPACSVSRSMTSTCTWMGTEWIRLAVVPLRDGGTSGRLMVRHKGRVWIWGNSRLRNSGKYRNGTWGHFLQVFARTLRLIALQTPA